MELFTAANVPALPTGLSVAVYLAGTSTLATIYDRTGAPLANPFTVAFGRLEFQAANGRYDVKLGGGAGSPDVSWNGGAALWLYGVALSDAGLIANPNLLINGGFDVWQRGTSLIASAATRHLADRWLTAALGTTIAPSRQVFAAGQTDVPGNPRYFHRCIVASVVGAGNYALMQHRIEGVHTLAGQTATISFYARASAALNITAQIQQYYGTTGSAMNIINGSKVAVGTGWTKYTVTFQVPSVSGKTIDYSNDSLQLNIWFDAGTTYADRTVSLGHQSGTFDIALVKQEEGPIATPYPYEDKGEMLRKCQRYYYNSYWQNGINSRVNHHAMVGVETANYLYGDVRFPVTMRSIPAVTLYNPDTGAVGVRHNVANLSYSAIGNLGAGGFSSISLVSGGAIGAGSMFHVEANAEL